MARKREQRAKMGEENGGEVELRLTSARIFAMS
jgi:hypothetical protein